ncbi:MAG: energy-coupling factor transporter ATPase [Clostridia bacterium]|nr:energy-coupling factor transporter ATPase [Clostridia bacterium]
MDKIIITNDVVYKYDNDQKNALDNVNIQVEKGEFVVILGHNGSGKSTLAKHFNVLLKPTSGTVVVKGMRTDQSENIWDIRQSAGMIFQNPDNQLVATLVEEDVAFGPENLGIPPEEIRQRVNSSLEAVNMEKFKTYSPHMLSGGQKQRIAIAGILAMKPECIILDEATAMLDPEGRKEVMTTIKKLNQKDGITIIHITHYMEEAVNADRVIVMEDGRNIMEGTPKQIFSRVEQLKSVGLDVPQVTQLGYELKKEGLDFREGILTVEEMVEEICRLL